MCNVCSKTFKTSRLLRQHQRFHIPVNQRRFVCNECDKRFVTKTHLTDHYRSLHTNERPEVCHLCAKSFPDKRNLRGHLRKHGAIPALKCDFEDCNEEFIYSAQLRRHKQEVHGKDSEQLICKLCNISFEHFVKLRYHNEKKHAIKK